jgi:hypothetical protein
MEVGRFRQILRSRMKGAGEEPQILLRDVAPTQRFIA